MILSKITTITHNFKVNRGIQTKPPKATFLVLLSVLKSTKKLIKQKYYTPLYFDILPRKLKAFSVSNTTPLLKILVRDIKPSDVTVLIGLSHWIKVM